MKIIYTRPDGGISVVHAAAKGDLERTLGPLTDEAYRAHVYERSIPKDATNVREVTASDIPTDRTFRNAWKNDLTVDMVKAREIHRGKLRDDRAPLLAQLDVDYQRADEKGDTKAKQDIAKRKQDLRDATANPAIDAAATPEALKAVTL